MKRSLVIIGLSLFFLASCSGGSVVSLGDTHIHGIAVDRRDSSRLYIATHDGLLVLQNDTALQRVGSSRDDYMGFSPHPTDPNIIFSSGHPRGGGNLGVRKSTDRGVTWMKVSDGDEGGPVDFHAMTVDEANPQLLYGWYAGHIYRSEDGGNTWTALKGRLNVMSFATDPRDENVLYVATEGGLLKSADRGATWRNVTPTLIDDVVIDVETNPKDGSLLLATGKHGIMWAGIAPDGGFTVEPLGTLPDDIVPMQVALDRKNTQVIYVASAHTLYKSSDGGASWQRVP